MADLLDLLREWNEATLRLTQCQKSCEYDADYFCFRQIEAEREAREAYHAAFEAAIDARIDAKLRERESSR